MARKVAFGCFLTRGSDRCELAAILIALARKFGVFALCDGEQARNGGGERSRTVGPSGSPQKDPAALAAALCKTRIDENSDVTRNARLALPQHLRNFAHGKLHRAQQAQYSQAGRVCQRTEDRIDVHHKRHIKIFLCL